MNKHTLFAVAIVATLGLVPFLWGQEAPSVPAAPVAAPVVAPLRPTFTPVSDGYYVKFSKPTTFSGITIPPGVQGNYELGFEMTPQEMVQPSQPILDPTVLSQLANYWVFRRQPQRAVSIYQRALAVAPEGSPLSLVLNNNYALLLSSSQGNHEAAIDLLNRSLEKFPDSVPLLDSKGLVYLNAGNPVDAVPNFERAVMLSCEGPIYVLHLANALDQIGEGTRAQGWFDKARLPLEGLAPKMSPENRGMFDGLQMKFVP